MGEAACDGRARGPDRAECQLAAAVCAKWQIGVGPGPPAGGAGAKGGLRGGPGGGPSGMCQLAVAASAEWHERTGGLSSSGAARPAGAPCERPEPVIRRRYPVGAVAAPEDVCDDFAADASIHRAVTAAGGDARGPFVTIRCQKRAVFARGPARLERARAAPTPPAAPALGWRKTVAIRRSRATRAAVR